MQTLQSTPPRVTVGVNTSAYNASTLPQLCVFCVERRAAFWLLPGIYSAAGYLSVRLSVCLSVYMRVCLSLCVLFCMRLSAGLWLGDGHTIRYTGVLWVGWWPKQATAAPCRQLDKRRAVDPLADHISERDSKVVKARRLA